MYYHGSNTKLRLGDAIYPNPKGYTNAHEVRALEDLFESVKPANIEFSRKDCVFLCDCEEDIDNAGGHTDYIYKVDLESGFTEKSDMSWYTKSSVQLADGNIKGAKKSAEKYWSGEANEGVYEYRTDEVLIISEV